VHNPHGEAGWRVMLAETGEATLTAGRLGPVTRYRLVAFHRGHGKLATLTAVRPSSRFGEVTTSSCWSRRHRRSTNARLPSR
jgi:glucose-1-phosphate cytidylyltransferase